MGSQDRKSGKIALMGILTALTVVLSIVESLIPIFNFLPGFKLGISNIVILFALSYIGILQGLALAIAKSLFVFVTRGGSAFLMSLVGGLTATAVMAIFLLLISRYLYGKMSPVSVTVAGAVFHNLGQLAVVALYTDNYVIRYYFPFLVLAGVVTGLITGVIYIFLERKVFKYAKKIFAV